MDDSNKGSRGVSSTSARAQAQQAFEHVWRDVRGSNAILFDQPQNAFRRGRFDQYDAMTHVQSDRDCLERSSVIEHRRAEMNVVVHAQSGSYSLPDDLVENAASILQGKQDALWPSRGRGGVGKHSPVDGH